LPTAKTKVNSYKIYLDHSCKNSTVRLKFRISCEVICNLLNLKVMASNSSQMSDTVKTTIFVIVFFAAIALITLLMFG
jgi:hypothetical protein